MKFLVQKLRCIILYGFVPNFGPFRGGLYCMHPFSYFLSLLYHSHTCDARFHAFYLPPPHCGRACVSFHHVYQRLLHFLCTWASVRLLHLSISPSAMLCLCHLGRYRDFPCVSVVVVAHRYDHYEHARTRKWTATTRTVTTHTATTATRTCTATVRTTRGAGCRSPCYRSGRRGMGRRSALPHDGITCREQTLVSLVH